MSNTSPSCDPTAQLTATVDVDELSFDDATGLIPVVVQDAASLRVLMVGYTDRQGVIDTQTTGKVTFYSRSRQERWVKGETSGNWLTPVSVGTDCDRDTLLVTATPDGPTCHTGAVSCFDSSPDFFLGELNAVVKQRYTDRPDGSYTTSLFESGTRRIAQKVGEEGVETALAAVAQGDEELLGESADLLFHLLVLLRDRGLDLQDVLAVLAQRHGTS